MVNVIFQDNHLLVLNKPAGLVVDPSNTNQDKTLADILTEELGIKLLRGGIVHRLDKDTSGIILAAKTQETLDNLQGQFKSRLIKKEYLALVHGVITDPGKIDAAIGRNPENREKFIVFDGNLSEDGGKEAVTEYEPIQNLQFTIDNLQLIFSDYNKIQMRKLERQNYGEFTLLRCKPQTGRTHQIRVHLKYINHPIVSDEKYVGRKMFRLDNRWCNRMFLHAAKITFKHPESGEWLEFECGLSEDLEKALGNLI